MTTTPDEHHNFISQKKSKIIGFILVLLFLFSGAIGHDPWWKKGETYSFGIIYHFYQTDTWLVPTNAGVPFMEKPPLYYWTARIMCNAFGGFLPLHDAARLASVFYTALAAFFVWKTALVLFKDYQDKKSLALMAVALFLGNYGTAIFSHAMITDVALAAGSSIAIYGLVMLYKLPQYWKWAGVWIGIGLGIAFLTKGLIMPVVLAASWLIMICLIPNVKNKTNMRAILLAAAVSTPFFIIWPWLLYQHSPTLFMEWFWDNNIGRFLGFSVNKLGAENRRGNFLFMLPICSFPIFPLACIEVFMGRKEWRRTEYILPLIISLIGILILFCSASFRTIYLMPLFLPFSLLGVQGLTRIPEQKLVVWNKIVRILFTLSIIAVWVIWCNLHYTPAPHALPWLASLFENALPSGFVVREPQYIAMIAASIATLGWLSFQNIKSNTAFSTATLFMCGAITVWCTSHTLLLPWINEAKSFRPVIEELDEYVRKSPYSGQCVANYHLGENLGPMVEYFMGMTTPLPQAQSFESSPCPMILGTNTNLKPGDYPGWELVWSKKDLELYERINKLKN